MCRKPLNKLRAVSLAIVCRYKLWINLIKTVYNTSETYM